MNRFEPLGRNNCWKYEMSIAQLIGNFRLFASLPAFLVYYFFYSSFDSQNPEGQIKDTKVVDLIYRLLFHKSVQYTFRQSTCEYNNV